MRKVRMERIKSIGLSGESHLCPLLFGHLCLGMTDDYPSGSVSEFFFSRPDQGGSGSPGGEGSLSGANGGRNRRVSGDRDAR